MGRKNRKTDRYGKKYSWIAFFEMYGVRQDERRLAERRLEERISDCDIDPSFPEQVPEWNPELPDLFSEPYTNPVTWLAEGTTPRYENLFRIASIDEIPGPWVLLDGFIEESADDPRRGFHLFRGFSFAERTSAPFASGWRKSSIREGRYSKWWWRCLHIRRGSSLVEAVRYALAVLSWEAKRNIQRAFEWSGGRRTWPRNPGRSACSRIRVGEPSQQVEPGKWNQLPGSLPSAKP